MLINRNNPSRYYIGSSVNMGRRLAEYFALTTSSRTPKTSAERELASLQAKEWNVVILNVCIPQLALILEQLAFFVWLPTINSIHTVVPRVLPS